VNAHYERQRDFLSPWLQGNLRKLRERRCLRVITTSLLLKRLSLFRCVKTIYPCSAPPCHTCSSLAKPSLIVQIITKRAKSLLFWSVYSNHDSVVRWHHFKSSSIPNNLMKIILLELSGFAPPRPQVKSSDETDDLPAGRIAWEKAMLKLLRSPTLRF
jgi:hypothetical protein